MEARLLPCGERAVLVEVSDLDAVLALHAAVSARVAQEGPPDTSPGSATELPGDRSVSGRGQAHGVDPGSAVGVSLDDRRADGPLPDDLSGDDIDDFVVSADMASLEREELGWHAASHDADVGGDGAGDGADAVGWLWGQVLDLVPAARTLLVTVETAAVLPRLRSELEALAETLAPEPPATGDDRTVTIPVAYDGPDLAEVASLIGLSEQEVVEAHTGTPWRVGFGGFAPGFAYLVDGDPRLDVARRGEPRTKVPPGAVGLAGTFSGVYPRSSPGGWQLIGRTDAVLWDEQRDPPALLRPGWSVRFEAVDPEDMVDAVDTDDMVDAVDTDDADDIDHADDTDDADDDTDRADEAGSTGADEVGGAR